MTVITNFKFGEHIVPTKCHVWRTCTSERWKVKMTRSANLCPPVCAVWTHTVTQRWEEYNKFKFGAQKPNFRLTGEVRVNRSTSKSPFLTAPRVWYSLPPETRACSSLLTFRRETKSHLFRQSYGWLSAVYSDGQQTSALSCATV